MPEGITSFSADPEAGFNFAAMTVRKVAYVNVLFALFLIVPDLYAHIYTPWQWGGGGGLSLLGFYASLRWRYGRQTLRALLLLFDRITFSFSPLILIVFWRSGITSDKAWLYLDYRYVYSAIFLVIFFVTMFMPSRTLANKFEAMNPYYPQGTIPAGDLYRLWFYYRGAEQWQKGGQYAILMGVMATSGLIASAIGGSDYLFFYLFILGLPLMSLLLGGTIGRRLRQGRYFQGRDLLILRSDNAT